MLFTRPSWVGRKRNDGYQTVLGNVSLTVEQWTGRGICCFTKRFDGHLQNIALELCGVLSVHRDDGQLALEQEPCKVLCGTLNANESIRLDHDTVSFMMDGTTDPQNAGLNRVRNLIDAIWLGLLSQYTRKRVWVSVRIRVVVKGA